MADVDQRRDGDKELLADAREVVRSEAASIASVAAVLDEGVVRAIRLIHERTDDAGGKFGTVVVSGVGKSGAGGAAVFGVICFDGDAFAFCASGGGAARGPGAGAAE